MININKLRMTYKSAGLVHVKRKYLGDAHRSRRKFAISILILKGLDALYTTKSGTNLCKLLNGGE